MLFGFWLYSGQYKRKGQFCGQRGTLQEKREIKSKSIRLAEKLQQKGSYFQIRKDEIGAGTCSPIFLTQIISIFFKEIFSPKRATISCILNSKDKDGWQD